MDYFGGMVNRTARVTGEISLKFITAEGVAKGGQIFISGKVWELVKSEVAGISQLSRGISLPCRQRSLD